MLVGHTKYDCLQDTTLGYACRFICTAVLGVLEPFENNVLTDRFHNTTLLWNSREDIHFNIIIY